MSPLMQPLHDDHFGRRPGVGFPGRQGFVVDPDRLLALDVAFGAREAVNPVSDCAGLGLTICHCIRR